MTASERNRENTGTGRAYASDWRDFEAWCGKRGFPALPGTPETIALYLRSLDDSGRALNTIRRRLAAINQRYAASGHAPPGAHPLIRDVVAEIRQVQEIAQAGKTPILMRDLRRMLAVLPDSPGGIRDRAILLVGFEGALRRSDLVALNVDDLDQRPDGIRLRVQPGGTRQNQRERLIALPRHDDRDTCPTHATEAWLESARISSGPLFRPVNRHGQVRQERLSDKAVALVVKRAAQDAGLDPSRYAGHSLRSGGVLSKRLGSGSGF